MRHALVTGASSGIGLETARRLRAAGLRVTALARSFADGFPLADDADVTCVAFDLARVDAVDALVAGLPPIDVLVNNAGVMRSEPWDAYSDAGKRATLAVNLEAPIALITAVAPAMRARGGGRVVNNASIAGHVGHPDVWYGASKAGLINATKSFARLLGPAGVVVNAVAAGPVETAMLGAIPAERQAQIAAAVISGRFARPAEVADVIAWLATDSPEYVNGVVIDINNGAFMR